jgi:tetratricopeptide (TPR) repeat protein
LLSEAADSRLSGESSVQTALTGPTPHAWSGYPSTPRISIFVGALLTLLFSIYEQRLAAQEVAVPPADPAISQAEGLLRQGKPAEALTLLNGLATADPHTPGLEAELGKAYFQSKQFPQAVPHLKTALRQNPSDMESTQLLALSYFATGDCSQALPLLEKLGPRLPKDTADAPYLLASCYVMAQRWDDARKTFANLFSVAPDSAMAYLMFGKFLVRQRLKTARCRRSKRPCSAIRTLRWRTSFWERSTSTKGTRRRRWRSSKRSWP